MNIGELDSITDFNITSMSIKNQVEQSLKRYKYETTPTTIHNLPTKQEIINLLALQGQVNMFVIGSISLLFSLSLQLEPSETKLLFLKENSLHFLFDPISTLSGSQQGKCLHILLLVDNIIGPLYLVDTVMISFIRELSSISKL